MKYKRIEEGRGEKRIFFCICICWWWQQQ